MNRRYFMLGMAAGGSRRMRPPTKAAAQRLQLVGLRRAGHHLQFRSGVWCGRRYATYESNEEMLAKVITGNSGWDIVSRLTPAEANAGLWLASAAQTRVASGT